MELFLIRSIPQRDIKPLAKALLTRFCGVAPALSAPIEELCQVAVKDNHGKSLCLEPKIVLDL